MPKETIRIPLRPGQQHFVRQYRAALQETAAHPAVVRHEALQETLRNFLCAVVQDAEQPPDRQFTLAEDGAALTCEVETKE